MRRVAAIAVDVACVVGFVALGRRSHAEVDTVAGIAAVAAPFLVGTAAGWAVARRAPRPDGLRAGLIVWGATVVVGLALRAGLTGRPTPIAFIAVAGGVLAAALLGWRGIRTLAVRRRGGGLPGTAPGS